MEASFHNASIRIVISLVNALIHQLEVNNNDDGISNMKKSLLASLNQQFGNTESIKHYALATVLDLAIDYVVFLVPLTLLQQKRR